MTLMPGKEIPEVNFFNFDKLIHVLIFGLLVLFLIVGFLKQYRVQSLRKYALSITPALVFLYSLSIEVLQIYIPGRSFDVYDLLANTVGCIAGIGMFYVIYRL